MGGILMTIGYFAFIGLLILGAKWIHAGFSILTGDKESLREFGNLCDKEDYRWQERHWRYQDDWRNKGEGNMM
jgi:hypothetical protein